MESRFLIKDKVAFVTGATRGIGWAIAQCFADSGATVFLNGHSDASKLDERVAHLKNKYGIPAFGLFGDVADGNFIKAVYQEIFGKCQRLDILVNNAGIMETHLLGMIPNETVEKQFRINTFATLYHIQAASKLMKRNRKGSILNLSSIVGAQGSAGSTVYAGTKAAIIGITKSAAKELAPDNIRVNAIAPGFIDTEMVKKFSPEKVSSIVQNIGLKRVGTPDDVAQVALFLASDLSSYVTGQVIGVDGGMVL